MRDQFVPRMDLYQKTLELLLQIPPGKVTTYKDLALALGDARAARAVGEIMSNNRRPEKYPCWRVVHTDGRVGKYSGEGGREEKVRRMEEEGISVSEGKIGNFGRVRFADFESDRPLKKLRGLQRRVGEESEEKELDIGEIERIGGVDLSYSGRRAVAAYVEMRESGGEELYRETLLEEVNFPYIPTFLAFREIPPMAHLLEKVKEERGLANLILVDGNGRLHPLGAGSATHLGVALEWPTAGVAKKLLCGETEGEGELAVGEKTAVNFQGEKIGYALKTSKRANPIYVSRGHLSDLSTCVEAVLKSSRYKLPEPLREAHKLCKGKASSL